MIVTRQGFSGVVANAFAGLGFPSEAPTVYEFAHPLFWTDSDLTPVRENIDKIIYGLTEWEPQLKETGIVVPPKLVVEGENYQEALDNMDHLFIKNMWGDGLPMLPPTEERVAWILTGTDLSPDLEIGKIMPRGGIATVETIAATLAMAGGRPEYLPVLIAATEALVTPEYGLASRNSTTNSNFPVVVVNGSVGRDIRLASNYGALGPDPLHPAAGSIGRAVRLILQNVGGGVPGIGTMAIHGYMRHTNAVFAEAETSPWPALSTEMGVPEGRNAVTVFNANGVTLVTGSDVSTPETAEECLYKAAWYMRVPNFNTIGDGAVVAGAWLIADESARGLADAGWTKDDIKAYLWENSKVSVADLTTATRTTTRSFLHRWEAAVTEGVDRLPQTADPELIQVIVVGGSQAGHGAWMQSMGGGRASVEIQLPANWDELMAQAEVDLGPAPAD